MTTSRPSSRPWSTNGRAARRSSSRTGSNRSARRRNNRRRPSTAAHARLARWALLALVGSVASGAGLGPRGEPQDRTVDLSPVPSAPEYQTEPPTGPGFLGSDADVLNRGLARINAALGADLRPDVRLAQLARWVYDHRGPERALPSQAVMDVLTHRLGLPEPAPHLLVTNAPDGTRAAGIVSSRLARLFEVRDYTHIGGVAERERSGVVMVVVLSRRRLTLRPLPRRLDGPGAFRLEGRLAAGYRRPELAHMLPDGRTGREPLGEGKAFGRTVLLAERGRHRIEVLAQGPEGSIVLANFPVFVGVPVDEKAEADAPPGPAVRADEVRDALLALINAARARAGLDPVSPDPVLDEAARRHSEDMCDNGFIAHVSPTAGGTDERLARAGIVAILAAENVGKGYGAEELHGGFMDSPGHRGAVLLDRATHVGIGVAAKKEGDLTTYYATEIFIRRIPPLPADAKSRLLRELDARRGSAGLGRLAEDGSLSEMAETAARGFLLDPSLSQNDAARRLAQRLEGTFKMRTSLTVLFSVVGSVEDSARQAAADKHCLRARQIGIGLAQGDRPGLPANAIVLVLIFSE